MGVERLSPSGAETTCAKPRLVRGGAWLVEAGDRELLSWERR